MLRTETSPALRAGGGRRFRLAAGLCFALLIAFRLLYYYCLDRFMAPDSYEYIARDGFAWLRGAVDRYRLPLYPLLIDFFRILDQDRYLDLLTLFQLGVSLLSLGALWAALRKLTERTWLSLLGTLLYGTLNAVSGWDKTVLTESLSLSLTVFVLWGLVSWLRDRRTVHALLTALFLLAGCLLRAVFAIYAGLFFGFFLLQLCFPGAKEDRPQRRRLRLAAAKGALAAAVPVLLVLLYALAFQARWGAFTLSDSGLGQQLYLVLAEGYYEDSEDAELAETASAILNSRADSESEELLNSFFYNFYRGSVISPAEKQRLKEDLLSRYAARLDPAYEEALEEYIREEYENDYDCSFTSPTYLTRLYLMENYDRARLVRFADEAKARHRAAYLAGLVYHAFEAFTSRNSLKEGNLPTLVSGLAEYGLFFLRFSLVHALLAALIEGLVFLRALFRRRRAEWLRLGLCALIGSTALLSILGTCGSYARTAITLLPFLFAALALWGEALLDRPQKSPEPQEDPGPPENTEQTLIGE